MSIKRKTLAVTTVAVSTVGVVSAVAPVAAEAATARTIAGPSVNTKYGPVQVSIKVKGMKVKSVTASYPTDLAKSAKINNAAVAKLKSSALSAQSSKIATVSGATYTSKGFKKSLAAALAKR